MRKSIGYVLCLMLLMVACSPQEEIVLPTEARLDADVTAEAVASPEVDESPTETPIPPTPTRQFELPPTWTPTDVPPTSTPIILPTDTPLPTPVSLPPACDVFAADFERSDSQFTIGAQPLVAWIAAPGAELYRLRVIDEFGATILDEYLRETEYRLPSDIFEVGRRYGWEVIPLDSIGDQMCYQRGDILIPIRVGG